MGLAYVQVWPKYLDICFAITYGVTLILAYTIPESFVRRWLQVITQGGVFALITVRKCNLLMSAGLSAHVLNLSLRLACHIPKCSCQRRQRRCSWRKVPTRILWKTHKDLGSHLLWHSSVQPVISFRKHAMIVSCLCSWGTCAAAPLLVTSQRRAFQSSSGAHRDSAGQPTSCRGCGLPSSSSQLSPMW